VGKRDLTGGIGLAGRERGGGLRGFLPGLLLVCCFGPAQVAEILRLFLFWFFFFLFSVLLHIFCILAPNLFKQICKFL
jgi:hypothetical protein